MASSARIRATNFGTITELLRERFQAERAIAAKRSEFGWFGAATSNIEPGAGGVGYFRHFGQASVFWTPQFGAHEVHGAIRRKYASLGWEASYLGYPTTDELGLNNNMFRYSNFQRGTISWAGGLDAFINLTVDRVVVRHSLGVRVYISGQGATPGGTVRFTVEGLEGATGAKSIGVFDLGKWDGQFAVTWDAQIWSPWGMATLRAWDQATGRTAIAPIPQIS